ncbi:hypothetical protein ACSBR1_039598 [Camellia fascicularis]
MGRVKLKIKRLESTSNQQVTYSRRRNEILKKAKELSILCGIDIALLMFSPTGKAALFRKERRYFQVSNCAYIKMFVKFDVWHEKLNKIHLDLCAPFIIS